MHKVPVNQPDVIQSIMLLQEAAVALGITDIAQDRIRKLGGGEYPYSEAHLTRYVISKKLDKPSSTLLAKGCYQDNDVAKGERRNLALNWDKADDDENGWKSSEDDDDLDGSNHDVAVTASPVEQVASSAEEIALPAVETTPSATSVIANTKPTRYQKRKAMDAFLEGKATKRRKITQVTSNEILKQLQRRAGRLQRMIESRQILQGCHTKFERDVRPGLIAALTPE
jgi:hypothetical protein